MKIEEKIKLYRSIFKVRTDIYAKYWTNFKDKSGYSPVYQLNKQPQALTDEVILNHLIGSSLIGIYPLLKDNTTYFLAIDFDKGDWLKESLKVMQVAEKNNISAYLEKSKSGNGAHIWIFFTSNISAFKAWQLGKYLLQKAEITTRKTFDRMFPSQDEHQGKGYGNLIALPLQGENIKLENSVFIDKNGKTIDDQWSFLENIKKNHESVIDNILNQNKITFPQVVKSKPKSKMQEKEIEDHQNQEESQITKINTTQNSEAKLIISSQIFIPELYLPDKLYKFLKKKLNFPNPKYYELEKRGYSTWKTPRFQKHIDQIDNGILIPTGFLCEIENFAKENSIKLIVENQQITCKSVSFKTKLKLKPEQQIIVKELLDSDRIIFEAKPGFGKTMVALYCIKRRRQPTLIIVHTKELLHQWKKRIKDWFELEENDIGIIGDNQWEIGNKITIASYQTLAKRGVAEIKDKFGFVIVDECHHVPAKTLTNVVKNLPAKYVLGLTATAYRKDNLDRLMLFYLGQIVTTSWQQSKKQQSKNIPTVLMTRSTTFSAPQSALGEFNDLSQYLIADQDRNILIAKDVAKALQTNAKCMILTERIDHCDILLKEVRKQIKGVHAAIISGKITKKKREQISKRLTQDQFKLLVATGKLIGEGFDWPELTHLFLAFPFSWKGKLVQYVGRIQRTYDGKEKAYVYDYIDNNVQMLKIMYYRRLRTYRKLQLEKVTQVIPKKKIMAENQLSFF